MPLQSPVPKPAVRLSPSTTIRRSAPPGADRAAQSARGLLVPRRGESGRTTIHDLLSREPHATTTIDSPISKQMQTDDDILSLC